MHEDGTGAEGFHHFAKRVEVLCRGIFEIDGDMDVSHAEAGGDATFVWNGIVGGGQGQVDDGFETGFAYGRELRGIGLTGSAELWAEQTKASNLLKS